MSTKVQERLAQLTQVAGMDAEGWLSSADKQVRVERTPTEAERHEEYLKRALEEQRRWSEEIRRREAADAAFVAGIISANPTIAALGQAVVTAESELGRLQVALTDIRDQLARFNAKVEVSLTDVPLEELANAAVVRKRAEANALEQTALASAESEILRRIGECEAWVNEAKAAHKHAQRVQLHRYCDQLITQVRPQLKALHTAMAEIRRVEGLIREHGGQRQCFSSAKFTQSLEWLTENYDKDVTDIVRFSEQYERAG